MKKIKSILIILLFILFPSTVFASSGSSNEAFPVGMALGMEAFVSIHMSIFVLMPLSKIISKENSKKTFWIMFGIRVAILLFFDLFITTGIAVVDFIAVFIGALIIIPIASTKGVKGTLNTTSITNSSLNNDVTPQSNEENAEEVKDASPIVLIDPKYLNSENALLRNIVKGEIESQGENANELTTVKINTKRNIVIVLFGILTFIYVMMYFFNIELTTCLICEAITLLLYIFIVRKFNIVNVISKRAKKNPNEDIAQMVAEVKMNKKQVAFPIFLKTGILVLAAIFVPMIIFSSPKILYFNYGNGYAVVKYTRGLTKQNDNIVIPDIHNGKDVVAIGDSAFKNTNIKNVTLPKNLESIKANAFYNCPKLESIYVPQKVTEIRASAFENCLNLKTVSLPNGIVDIRASAFKNDTKLVGVELPESLEYLGAGVFSHCSSLQEITIPNKVIEINGQTFEYCTSLRRLYLHDNIISIHGENFIGCVNLNNVTLPSKITEIRGNTFENCTSLSSIVIPEGVTRIGGHAFYGCRKLSSVIVPRTVVEIGSSAFRQCTSLRTIKVPRNALINERAFKESPTLVTYY